ncbi:hypothetical protein EDD22DRAFT_959096 [Suillus occidentalis]|nr:hypothetical protein EDD22DRAFT_959096 [Suillus occidentalis]
MGSNLSPDSSDTTLALLTQLVQIGLGSSASIYPGPFHCQYKDPIDRLRKLVPQFTLCFRGYARQAVARRRQGDPSDFSATLPLPLNRPRANNPPSPLCPMVGHCSSSVKRKQKTREPQQKIANTIDAPLGHATYADIVGVDNGEQPYVLFFCLSWFKKKKKKEVQQPPVYDDELEDDEEEEIVLDPVAVPLPWAHFTYLLSTSTALPVIVKKAGVLSEINVELSSTPSIRIGLKDILVMHLPCLLSAYIPQTKIKQTFNDIDISLSPRISIHASISIPYAADYLLELSVVRGEGVWFKIFDPLRFQPTEP